MVMLNVLIMVLAAWKWGYRGFIPCLAVGLGALVYALDARLLQPPPDFTLRETISVVTGKKLRIGKGDCTVFGSSRVSCDSDVSIS
jgi:hypothetical protein